MPTRRARRETGAMQALLTLIYRLFWLLIVQIL